MKKNQKVLEVKNEKDWAKNSTEIWIADLIKQKKESVISRTDQLKLPNQRCKRKKWNEEARKAMKKAYMTYRTALGEEIFYIIGGSEEKVEG